MNKFDVFFKSAILLCEIASTAALFDISTSLKDIADLLDALVNVAGN
ncbi:hypothetical protein NLX67_20400 [Domibacillus sp. A3M-37]|nr:hypothetical protein [Domibacillus sp. A3M-37]MCP3764702.1 hypothetical protein [Domibacillus sp. A3M-37]